MSKLEPSTEEAVKKVTEILKITNFEKNVETVKQWMTQQPHLPEVMDDKQIQNFLILNKGNIEKAKEKIDFYYTARTKWDDLFQSANPKLFDLQSILDSYYFVPSLTFTPDMCRVAFFKIRDKHLATEVDHWNSLRFLLACQEIRLLEDVCYGDVFVMDCTDVPLKFILKVTPFVIYRAVMLYEGIYSMRIKAIYLINASPAIEKLLKVIKLFVKPKIFSRIQLCDSYEILKTTFGTEFLPKDYGGEEKSLEELQKMLKLKLAEYQRVYDRLDTLRVDEALRPLKAGNLGLTRYFSFRRPKQR